ncbi:hypothetical protein [Amycolatopsis magusensis]|uniref:hypothetical protein n=1 Tax=Amycolatopsis magusensis TaxID=882444 RepID=UPI00379A410B
MRVVRVVFSLTFGLLLMAACGQSEPESATSPVWPAAIPETTTTSTSTTPPTVTSKPAQEVTIRCYLDETFGSQRSFSVGESLDFGQIWTAEPKSCEATRAGAPLTEREQEAFRASGYDAEASITTLYGLCAEVDSTNTYASGKHSASASQVQEILGVLALCPDHPHAAKLKATADRGVADADLEKAGRLFGAGTFRVGEEVKPGKYVSEGDIEGCYWERTDSKGEIIDNNFVNSAKRVEVTIRSGDYSFHSERCGQWRGR